MKIFIKTLGCRANRYESEKLIQRLSEAGHNVVTEPVEADVVVVNTCTVTHVADRKSRQAARGSEAIPAPKKIVVFGCGARVNREQFETIEGVELVAKEPDEVLDFLGEGDGGDVGDVYLTRTNLKIQDGCENFCTYCIIPKARGPQRSKAFNDVLEEAHALAQSGAKEIVLTGINIGRWEDAGMNFWALMKVLLDEVPARFRISSIEPFDFEPETLEVLEHPRFCKHLHLCIQSGSDEVLKRMGRNYKVKEFEVLVEKIRRAVPDIAITTDVIVGFPGETEAQHKESMATIKRIGFAKAHVFKYSKREGTPAAKVKDLPYQTKVKRSREMRKLADKLRLEYQEQFVGKTREVLFEQEKKGIWLGTTDNYLQVEMKSDRDLRNCLMAVRLGRLKSNGKFKGRALT